MPKLQPASHGRLHAFALLGIAAVIAAAVVAMLIATGILPSEPQIQHPQTPRLSIPQGFSLEDKIGQLLIVGVSDKATAVTLEQKHHIGGFLLKSGGNVLNQNATMAIKKAGKLPPLFAVDQEGGQVSRLPEPAFREFTAAHLGTLPDDNVRDSAEMMGQRLAAIGATNDLAPVVDLDNGHNAAISQFRRSFSSDPAIVTQKARAFADGLRLAGIIPTFKHFPGLGKATGPTNGNTDMGPATTPPLSTLEASDLKPYPALLNPGKVSTVMVGNQIVPGLTNGQPASLSPQAYDLLRGRFGFKQVVFTDELIKAKAIASVQPDPGAAVLAALKAGADMPLIDPTNTTQVDTIITRVTTAVRRGQLREARIDDALNRIMELKAAIRH